MASQVTTERAALKVLRIPELAHLICGTIRKGDNVSLMRTCRQLFYEILPFVWEEVDEANPLVSLIPGGGTVTYDSDLSPYVVMQLPSSLDLTRFNVYAPYVKRFIPFAPFVDEYASWENFLSCVQSIDLLPNLETLCVPVRDRVQFEEYCLNWVTAFLSSSLQTLELTYRSEGLGLDNQHVMWLDFDFFDEIMLSVAQKCSRLRSLSIFPASVRWYDSRWIRGPSQVSFSYDRPQVYSNFLQLKDLSLLAVSSAILNPEAFIALSGLPRLETLRIFGSELDRHTYCDQLELPNEAFPALKHLELSAQRWPSIGNLCSAKPVVAGLHSLTIENSYYSPESDNQYQGLYDIIPLLAANNSSITTLIVREYRGSKVPSDVLQSWRQLRLTTLHLEWSLENEHIFSTMYSIVSCLPLLEELKLDMGSPLDLRELGTVVQCLPRLRRIRAPLKCWSVTKLVETDFTPSRSQSTETLYLESNFYLLDPQQENAERLARCLSMLRPGGMVICQSHEKDFYVRGISAWVDEGPKNMINTELSRLRLG